MPIKNLTDRGTLKPRPPRLGKLRKGDEKTGNKPGEDLSYFRFTSNNPEVVTAFNEIYGKEPRIVNAVMYYHTYEECFSSWIESWDASGMVFRSDGEFWHIWRDGDKYKRGKKAHTDAPEQSEVGRLEFAIPELWKAGFRGTVTLETHSNHDLRQIGGVLLAAEEGRESLRGLPFILRRVQEEIGVPGWGDREGQRSKAKKWLVKLEPSRPMLLLNEGAQDDIPATAAIEAGDPVTGEVIEGDFDDEQPKETPKPKPDDSKHHSADPVTGELVKADGSRPYAPNVLHAKILESISRRRAADFRFPAGKLKDFQGAVRSNLETCFAGDKNSTDKRQLVAEYLVGEPSSKKWDDAQTKALHRWLNAKPDTGGNWIPDAMAVQEAVAVARKAAKEAGQTEMELPPVPPMRTFTRVELLAQWEKAINDARALNLPHDSLTTADATTEELAAAIDKLTIAIVAEESKINLE